MTSALLDDLLAGFATSTQMADANDAAANRAKSAKTRNRARLEPPPAVCEVQRNCAKTNLGEAIDSQVFAGLRRGRTTSQTSPSRGSSLDSHESQALTRQTVTGTWTNAACARFQSRRERLVRWGWTADEAETLAERLTIRDLSNDDDRVSCADCKHYQAGRCGNHQRAGLQSAALGRDLAGMLQRCPGFQP